MDRKQLGVRGQCCVNTNIGGWATKLTVEVANHITEDLILGIDAIKSWRLHYEPTYQHNIQDHTPEWFRGKGDISSAVRLASMSVTTIPVQIITEAGLVPRQGTQCMANVRLLQDPYVTGGPFLVETNCHGVVHLPLTNCSPHKVDIAADEMVAVIELWMDAKLKKSTLYIWRLWTSKSTQWNLLQERRRNSSEAILIIRVRTTRRRSTTTSWQRINRPLDKEYWIRKEYSHKYIRWTSRRQNQFLWSNAKFVIHMPKKWKDK